MAKRSTTNTKTTTLIILLLIAFSFLIVPLNAVPISRTRTLMHDSLGDGYQVSANSVSMQGDMEIGTISDNGRMNLELNDYPGSGANNRHTPKQQQWRGCFDC